MEDKKCKKCKITKVVSLFRIRKDSKDGYGVTCKECESVINKLYRTKNKEKIKNDRDNNKEKMKSYYQKRYKEKNEEIKLYHNNRYPKIRASKLEYDKLYREENIKKIKDYRRQYYLENKADIIKKSIDYKKKRMEIDPIFKLKKLLKTSINYTLKKKSFTSKLKVLEILGCSYTYFKDYIESRFEDWMTWDNQGLYLGVYKSGWDIDHIIPLSSAKTLDDVIKLNHFTNLQPLCSYVNRVIKRDKL